MQRSARTWQEAPPSPVVPNPVLCLTRTRREPCCGSAAAPPAEGRGEPPSWRPGGRPHAGLGALRSAGTWGVARPTLRGRRRAAASAASSPSPPPKSWNASSSRGCRTAASGDDGAAGQALPVSCPRSPATMPAQLPSAQLCLLCFPCSCDCLASPGTIAPLCTRDVRPAPRLELDRGHLGDLGFDCGCRARPAAARGSYGREMGKGSIQRRQRWTPRMSRASRAVGFRLSRVPSIVLARAARRSGRRRSRQETAAAEDNRCGGIR